MLLDAEEGVEGGVELEMPKKESMAFEEDEAVLELGMDEAEDEKKRAWKYLVFMNCWKQSKRGEKPPIDLGTPLPLATRPESEGVVRAVLSEEEKAWMMDVNSSNKR